MKSESAYLTRRSWCAYPPGLRPEIVRRPAPADTGLDQVRRIFFRVERKIQKICCICNVSGVAEAENASVDTNLRLLRDGHQPSRPGDLTCNHMVAYYPTMDEVFKALADASRRALLDRLHARNGQTLNELCDGLAMTRQAVTKHLGILEAANLVTTLRHGREKLHYLNPVPIHQIGERWIKKFERGKLTALSELKRQLEKRDE